MKKLVVVFIAMFCMTSLFAQKYSEYELRTKLRSSLKKKHVGQTLVIGGGILNVIGLGIWSSVEEGKHSFGSPQMEENFSKILGGTLLLIVGQVGLGVGIPLWITGGRRYNQYNRLLKKYDKNLSLKITNRGLGLHYNF